MSYSVFDELCKKKGVRPADVTRATGITSATFSEWKKGTYTPKADKLKKIADYFGVTVEYLKTGESQDGYYINAETAAVAQQIFDSKELSLLFDIERDMPPEDLQTLYQMALALKRKEKNYD